MYTTEPERTPKPVETHRLSVVAPYLFYIIGGNAVRIMNAQGSMKGEGRNDPDRFCVRPMSHIDLFADSGGGFVAVRRLDFCGSMKYQSYLCVLQIYECGFSLEKHLKRLVNLRSGSRRTLVLIIAPSPSFQRLRVWESQ